MKKTFLKNKEASFFYDIVTLREPLDFPAECAEIRRNNQRNSAYSAGYNITVILL